MAADLHIHIKTDSINETVMRAFCGTTMGSKYFNPFHDSEGPLTFSEAYGIVANTPNIWVGEVSWLKAWVLGDSEAYVPDAVAQISDLIDSDEGTLITDELIVKVQDAMDGDNQTSYRVEESDAVITFLRIHKGQVAFTVSW